MAKAGRLGSARKGGLSPTSGRMGSVKVGHRDGSPKAAPVGKLDDKSHVRTRGRRSGRWPAPNQDTRPTRVVPKGWTKTGSP